MNRLEPTNTTLPSWARIADGLALLLASAALWVVLLGPVRIGTIFSMSTPWRALTVLTIICGLRHYLSRKPPLHKRVWHWFEEALATLRRCGCRTLNAFKRATHMTVASALHFFALTALAVAQPLFDVVSREPTFFVARNTTSGQLAAFAVIVCVALPVLLIAIEAIFARVHVAAGNACHVVLTTALGGAFLLPIVKRAGVMDTVPLLAVSLMLAVAVTVGLQRFSVVRMFLTALSPAAVVVPAVFFANPDIRGAVVGPDLAPRPVQVEHAPPIVFVVFDEFPAASLLNARREIDRRRYPNFARLADDATWFRNASSVSSQTAWAVPAIVTGRYPVEPHAVPTLRYYPNNLFTMLSESYRMTVFGAFIQLCAANTCAYDLAVRDTLPLLTADLAVVYLHIIAPESLAAHLPPIVGDWRGITTLRRFPEVDGRRIRNDRASEYARFIRSITAERTGRLYFLHTMTPHVPFEYVPSGVRYSARDRIGERANGARLFLKSDPWYPVVLQQRHLLQVGFVDRFIGRLVDRLREQGIYDESLVIVTADHGASFRHGLSRRTIEGDDPADIIQVPLFVKLPHQTSGAISDNNVETVDIVPTIADVLSTSFPYEFDGRSLLDPSPAARQNKTFIRRNLERVRIRSYAPRLEDRALEQKLLHFESGLYGLGPHEAMVGRPAATIGVAAAGSLVSLENASDFANVDVERDALPLHVRGTISRDVTERLSLGIAINGVVAATTVSYRERNRWIFASMIPENALVPGANDLKVYVLGSVDDDA